MVSIKQLFEKANSIIYLLVNEMEFFVCQTLGVESLNCGLNPRAMVRFVCGKYSPLPDELVQSICWLLYCNCWATDVELFSFAVLIRLNRHCLEFMVSFICLIVQYPSFHSALSPNMLPSDFQALLSISSINWLLWSNHLMTASVCCMLSLKTYWVMTFYANAQRHRQSPEWHVLHHKWQN